MRIGEPGPTSNLVQESSPGCGGREGMWEVGQPQNGGSGVRKDYPHNASGIDLPFEGYLCRGAQIQGWFGAFA